MRIKKSPVKDQAQILDNWIIEARGKSKVISTSKIKKITAIKKNRREKGRRADPFGSNPHSKGEFFSRSVTDFFAKRDAKIITTDLIIRVKIIENSKIIIAFSKLSLVLLVGSQIYSYTKKASSSSVDCNI